MITKWTVCKGGMALFLMGMMFLSSLVYAQLPEQAPVNPALLNWLGNKDGEPNYGYVPSPLDRSHLTPSAVKDVPPAQFDLRTTDGVTSVKNQGLCGSCWSHAVCSALESWLKITTSEVFDFSENNMKNNHGFLLDHCYGGNNDMAVAYLARWVGPLLESEDPYNPSQSIPLITTPPPQKLLRQAPVFNLNGTDRAEIQNAIMTYGALSTPMYWNDLRYNSGAYTYYSNAAPHSSNHMIALVGWNDAKVISGAPGNGAWICKNSWGDWWGENGYFYISYYDTNIATEGCAAFVNLVNPDTYGTLYQHDPLGLTSYTGWGNTVCYGANVFTAVANEEIVAVGTYASTDNTAYQITVYNSGISGGNFYNPKATVSGTFTEAGYYVVDLPTAVNVSFGQTFSVVVRYQTPGWNFPVPLEAPQTYAAPTAAYGQSYMSPDGTGYMDIQSLPDHANANACIKAIAAAPDKTVRVIAPHWVEEGNPVTFTAMLPTLVGTPIFEWYKDEVLIIGADTDAYFIPAATFTDSGMYKLVVTDESKAVMESAPCEVLVLAEGSLPVSGMVALGTIALLLFVSGACLMVKVRKRCAE
jgi:C1A family cysteine protease